MLQQTQVVTVIPYYQRFMERFPSVEHLAQAELDDVLHLWSGLGYYARGRNLHRAAIVICDQYLGQLPDDIEHLQSLPGIGRSTAGAILALATGQRHAILDGNVKRVLARFAAVTDWPGQSQVLKQLWALSEYYTPHQRVRDHTQAMMDLGALVCTRKKPQCSTCPLSDSCLAYAQGQQHQLPQPKPRKSKPIRSTRMIMALNCDEVLLEKRPPTGIWGGLWAFPQCPSEADLVVWCQNELGMRVKDYETWATLRHTFSHFHFDITPVRVRVAALEHRIMEAERFVWYNIRQPDERGLARPVQRLLALLATDWW